MPEKQIVDRRKEAGTCTNCGARPAAAGHTKCEHCLELNRFDWHKHCHGMDWTGDSATNGAIAEHLAVARLLSSGHVVAKRAVDHAPFDLIIFPDMESLQALHDEGRLTLVDVKKGNRQGKDTTAVLNVYDDRRMEWR